MSSYDIAFAKTMSNEGEYDNDPDDVGGETFRGIARKFHPSWEGWKYVDKAKTLPNFPESLNSIPQMGEMVKQFYKAKYFDVFRGDDMPLELAMEMFDTSVNLGTPRAVKFLQTALNVLNRNGSLYADIVDDGAYGANTHNTLYRYLVNGDVNLLVKIINVLQGAHYIEYMRKSPTQEKFARGWFSRVALVK